VKGYFAILPDGTSRPAAVFENLEDAMDWGLRRFGADAFRIRRIDVLEVDDERNGAAGAA
jgi:hypothetical protein